MSIEDIEYLKEHSMQESYMFFVDSKFRDRDMWPTPQEYGVSFSTPFRNVYSIEILDASIPRTQYNVDTHNNTLYFRTSIVVDDGWDLGEYLDGFDRLDIPIGDYNDETLIDAINDAFARKDSSIGIRMRNLSDPADERSTFQFVSNIDFEFDMERSTIAQVLGFDLAATTADQDNQLYNTVVFGGRRLARIFQSIETLDGDIQYSVFDNMAQSSETVDIGPHNVYRFHFRISDEHNYRRIDRIRFKTELASTDEFDPTSVAEMYLYYDDNSLTVNVEKNYRLQCRGRLSYETGLDSFNDARGFLQADKDTLVFEAPNTRYLVEGDYIIFIRSFQAFRLFTSEASPTDRLYTHTFKFPTPSPTVTHTSLRTPTPTGTATQIATDAKNTPTITHPTPTVIHSHTATILGPSPAPSPSVTETMITPTITRPTPTPTETVTVTIPSPTQTVTATLPYPEQSPDLFPSDATNAQGGANTIPFDTVQIDGIFVVPSMEIIATDPGHQIVAPGIYSLIGDRYVVLRCPEIEQHMYRSRSYERYTLGLAKFKLASEGYDDSRLDYASLPPREFHPIGKLTNMTLRFERQDGSLYNFRGVNHTITVVIRYYLPKKAHAFSDYRLNPSYNPDYFAYIQGQESDEDEN